MKVVCIFMEGALYLIKNKIYYAYNTEPDIFIIKDNGTTIGEYSNHRFEKLSYVRNKVINKILDND